MNDIVIFTHGYVNLTSYRNMQLLVDNDIIFVRTYLLCLLRKVIVVLHRRWKTKIILYLGMNLHTRIVELMFT